MKRPAPSRFQLNVLRTSTPTVGMSANSTKLTADGRQERDRGQAIAPPTRGRTGGAAGLTPCRPVIGGSPAGPSSTG